MDELAKDLFDKLAALFKRLIIALVIIVIAFCLLVGTIVTVYFTADYTYPSYISNINSDNAENQIGELYDEETP